jgi:hypothetical protein
MAGQSTVTSSQLEARCLLKVKKVREFWHSFVVLAFLSTGFVSRETLVPTKTHQCILANLTARVIKLTHLSFHSLFSSFIPVSFYLSYGFR